MSPQSDFSHIFEQLKSILQPFASMLTLSMVHTAKRGRSRFSLALLKSKRFMSLSI